MDASRLLARDRCPKCGSKEIHRSHRKNIAERAFSFLVLPWRCSICYVRFFRLRWWRNHNTSHKHAEPIQ